VIIGARRFQIRKRRINVNIAGEKLITPLKAHVLKVMNQMPECTSSGPGASSRVIQDFAGLGLGLSL
jgi:hypothetical protein